MGALVGWNTGVVAFLAMGNTEGALVEGIVSASGAPATGSLLRTGASTCGALGEGGPTIGASSKVGTPYFVIGPLLRIDCAGTAVVVVGIALIGTLGCVGASTGDIGPVAGGALGAVSAGYSRGEGFGAILGNLAGEDKGPFVLGPVTGGLEALGLLLAWLDGNDVTPCGGKNVVLGASDPLTLVGTLGEACGRMGAAFGRPTTAGDSVGTRTSPIGGEEGKSVSSSVGARDGCLDCSSTRP
jgi:hypothetical protein